LALGVLAVGFAGAVPAGLLADFTFDGGLVGVGCPMAPLAWIGIDSEAVMPAPENVSACAA
jgi:hypothetical protein